MGHGRGESSVLHKLMVLLNSVDKLRAKELFIDFLAGDLLKDVERLRKFSTYFMKCPKLKRTYFDVLRHFQKHRCLKKRPAKTDNNHSAKKVKRDHIESLWQCDICGKKLKKGVERHKEKHKKEEPAKCTTNEDVKERAEKNSHFPHQDTKKPKLSEEVKRKPEVKIDGKKPQNDTAGLLHKEKHKKEEPAKCQPKNLDAKNTVNCEFCTATYKKDKLYAHYAGEHNVYCPEEIIFNSGNVLVATPMDTEGGAAKWFLEQREKAKGNDGKRCKLCKDFVSDSVDLLKAHYAAGIEVCGHNIDSKRLKYVENFFRAEKKSHFPLQDTKKPKKLSDEVKGKSDVKIDGKPQSDTAGLLMYVCKCDVATDKYDLAVEHAQRHATNSRPVTLTCPTCEFTFEATCFYDHTARYQKSCSRDDFIQLTYDHTKLKTSEWYDMFNAISADSRAQIVQSSIYQYTRSVLLKASSNTGIPAYQCAECQLCINPNHIEIHCNKGNCVKRKGYACPECQLHFINNNLLEAHKEDHKTGPMRLVVFNSKADVEFNNALLKVTIPANVNAQPSKENVAKVQKKITVISDVEIPDRYCNKCNNFVNNTVFEEHRAKHEEEEKNRLAALENDPNLSTSNNVEQDDHRDELVTEETTEVNNNENNELSDTDSCPSVIHTVGMTNAMIHEGEIHQKAAIARNENIVNNNADIRTPEQVMGTIFSDIAKTPVHVEDESQSTQEILSILDTDKIIEEPIKNNKLSLKERLNKMLPEDDSLEGLEELNEALSQLIREN